MEQDGVPVWLCTEDEGLHRQLSRQLGWWAESVCVKVRLLSWNRRPERFQDVRGILFLDGDSVDLGGLHALGQEKLAVVLISEDSSLCARMYRHHLAGFLSRPLTAQALWRVMDRCFPFWREGMRWLEVPSQRNVTRLPLCHLLWAEADNHGCILTCHRGSLRSGVSMGKLAQELPSPPFFQCQRSFIVHLGAVEELRGGELILRGEGKVISVGRKQLAKIQNALTLWKERFG